MTSPGTQSQLCTPTPILSLVQISFWPLPSSGATYTTFNTFNHMSVVYIYFLLSRLLMCASI